MADTKKYEEGIFQQRNLAYYISSKFFPKTYRNDIFKLYGFQRLVDDYTDRKPQQSQAFYSFLKNWDAAKVNSRHEREVSDDSSPDTRAVNNMLSLAETYEIDMAWIDTYLAAKKRDLENNQAYDVLDDTLRQLHDTAEMMVLMACRIMGLDPITYSAARLQARATQYVNFVRDIAIYNELDRCYIPREDLKEFDLPDMKPETALANKTGFIKCVQKQLARSTKWQSIAREDIVYLPNNCKVPLLTMMDMSDWTIATIAKDPFVIFDHQVRPAKHRVVVAGLTHILTS